MMTIHIHSHCLVILFVCRFSVTKMVVMTTVSVTHFKWSPQLERYKLCVMILLVSTVKSLFMETITNNDMYDK